MKRKLTIDDMITFYIDEYAVIIDKESPETNIFRRVALDDFVTYMDNMGNWGIRDIGESDYRAFYLHLQKIEDMTASLRKAAAVYYFLDYCVRAGWLGKNPWEDIGKDVDPEAEKLFLDMWNKLAD